MDFQLADRVARIQPSPTLTITARAKELKAAGKDIIGLAAGEPDFDTPIHIKEAAIRAIRNGYTKYTAVDGIPELKQAVIEKFARSNSLVYKPDQILISCGGKHSFYNLVQALLNPGDEVIIPIPYWVSYPDMVLLASGEPVFINADISQHFKITPEQLNAACTTKTRLFVINSPANPTGVAYTRDELIKLGEVLRSHPKILIATDDMYEHILWSQTEFCNILNVCPDLYDRTIVLNGVSKAYSMTGWRIGYAGGPSKIINAMKKIQSQSTSNPTSIAQHAALAAISGDQTCVTEMVKKFKQRHDLVVETLNSIKGVNCLPSDGTFYCFPNMQNIIDMTDNINNDLQLAEYLIEKKGIVMVPGSAFGAEGYMRLSFATSQSQLKKALDRLVNLFQSG